MDTKEELIDKLSQDVIRSAESLRDILISRQQKGRGRPKNPNANQDTRMTFVVNIEQLEKIREIGYRELLFTKDILFDALGAYIKDYESKNGVVIPNGKSKRK